MLSWYFSHLKNTVVAVIDSHAVFVSIAIHYIQRWFKFMHLSLHVTSRMLLLFCYGIILWGLFYLTPLHAQPPLPQQTPNVYLLKQHNGVSVALPCTQYPNQLCEALLSAPHNQHTQHLKELTDHNQLLLLESPAHVMASSIGIASLGQHRRLAGLFGHKGLSIIKSLSRPVLLALAGIGTVVGYITSKDIALRHIWLSETSSNEHTTPTEGIQMDAHTDHSQPPFPGVAIPANQENSIDASFKDNEDISLDIWLNALRRFGLVEKQDRVVFLEHLKESLSQTDLTAGKQLSLLGLTLKFHTTHAHNMNNYIKTLSLPYNIAPEAAKLIGMQAFKAFHSLPAVEPQNGYIAAHLHKIFVHELMNISVFSALHDDITQRLSAYMKIHTTPLSPMLLRSRLMDFYEVEILGGFNIHNLSGKEELMMDIFLRGILTKEDMSQRIIQNHGIAMEEFLDQRSDMAKTLKEYVFGSAQIYSGTPNHIETLAISKRRSHIKFHFLDAIASSPLVTIVNIAVGDDPLTLKKSFFDLTDDDLLGWNHNILIARLSDSLNMDMHHFLDHHTVGFRLRNFYRVEILGSTFENPQPEVLSPQKQLDMDIFMRLFLARNTQARSYISEEHTISGDYLLNRTEQLEDRLASYLLPHRYFTQEEALTSDAKVYALGLGLSHHEQFKTLYNKYLFDLKLVDKDTHAGFVKYFYDMFVHNEDSSLYAYRRDIYYHILLSLGGFNHDFLRRKLAKKHNRFHEDIRADVISLTSYLRILYLGHLQNHGKSAKQNNPLTDPTTNIKATYPASNQQDQHISSDVYRLDKPKLIQHIQNTVLYISKQQESGEYLDIEKLEDLQHSLSLYIKHLRIERLQKSPSRSKANNKQQFLRAHTLKK